MAHILIADDETAIGIVVRKWLENRGYRVTVANDGQEALRLALQLLPDLVILDIQMPYKTGIEVARELRRDPRFAHVPLIVMSAQLESLPRATAALFDAVLAKPFELAGLHAIVMRLLAQR